MPLDLLVPDLLLPADAPPEMRSLRLPAIERWLARATTAREPEIGLIAVLARLLRVPSPAPVAAISLAADVAPREGTWLRADPVHLRVDQDAIALHDGAILAVERDEAAALVGQMQSHFAADGLEFVAPAADRWYVHVPEGEAPRTVALEDAVGRNVFGLLPRGTGRINWPCAITEVQMLFASHPVNARREAEGRPAVNSVWFWGEGALPRDPASPYAAIYAGDPFARGFARITGTRSAEVPADLASVDAVRADESVLVVLDEARAPLRRGDQAAWPAAAARLDERWFAKLGEGVERFEGVRVILPGVRDTLVATIDAASRWRWFRTRRALASHA